MAAIPVPWITPSRPTTAAFTAPEPESTARMVGVTSGITLEFPRHHDGAAQKKSLPPDWGERAAAKPLGERSMVIGPSDLGHPDLRPDRGRCPVVWDYKSLVSPILWNFKA